MAQAKAGDQQQLSTAVNEVFIQGLEGHHLVAISSVEVTDVKICFAFEIFLLNNWEVQTELSSCSSTAWADQ